MNVLDLFSGIGGFSLGLERAGMRAVAFCECDPFCQRVLRRHWPDVVIYDDVRSLTAARLAAHAHGWRLPQLKECDGESQSGIAASQRSDAERLDIDLICGGFPCQDISVAGKGAGIGGERSGLWSQFTRIIGEVRPRYVIVENVAALLGRGLERVLGDLAALRYDSEWHCIPASAVGAPHRRDRVWIIASDAELRELRHEPRWGNGACGACTPILEHDGWWAIEPDVGRVAHGVSARVDRLRSIGNAVVPQIVEIIGQAIMTAAE